MNTEIIKLEQQLREHAIALVTLYERAKEIDKLAANRMLAGATNYIEELTDISKINVPSKYLALSK